MEIGTHKKMERCHKYTLVFLVVFSIGCLFAYHVFVLRSIKKPVPVLINTRTSVDPTLPRTFLKNYRSTNGDFQTVSGSNHTYVYSAYHEERQDKIRVIGFTLKTTMSLYCILWYMSNTNAVNSRLVNGYVLILPESHKNRYSASSIICYLQGNQVPDAVSIIENTYVTEPENYIPVVELPAKSSTKHDFTYCLSPIHNGYKDTDEIIEWLELLQLQGVTSVFVYLHDASHDVISVLNFYQSKGLVTILPWTLDAQFCNNFKGGLHYCGQMISLNDCIYRNKGRSKFVASFDLDELIIPQKQEDYTWTDMLKRLPTESIYEFRNVFFFPSNNKSASSNTETKMRISSNLLRDKFIFGRGDRSKWIVRTDDAVVIGIHFAWALTKNSAYTVPTDIGLLHHYRKTEVEYPQGVSVKRIKNLVTQKYHKDLELRVKHVHKLMFSNS